MRESENQTECKNEMATERFRDRARERHKVSEEKERVRDALSSHHITSTP